MKHRFIFRNPFVSERRKRTAKTYLDVARVQLGASVYMENKLGNSEDAIYYLTRSINYLDSAARSYGFRNISDMRTWVDVHGRLP